MTLGPLNFKLQFVFHLQLAGWEEQWNRTCMGDFFQGTGPRAGPNLWSARFSFTTASRPPVGVAILYFYFEGGSHPKPPTYVFEMNSCGAKKAAELVMDSYAMYRVHRD